MKAFCGRVVPLTRVPFPTTFPENEATCESCLRNAARKGVAIKFYGKIRSWHGLQEG
jgi:hypothetical protein